MLGTLRGFFSKLRPEPTHSPEGFPLVHRGFWYCGEWYSHRADEQRARRPWRSDHALWPIEGKVMLNFHWCYPQIQAGSDDRGLVDGLIPAMRLGDLVGLYEAGRARYLSGTGRHSDLAGWDDGKQVDLTFVRAVPVDQVPRLQEVPAEAPIDWKHVEVWSHHDPRRPGGDLIEENTYTRHWIDITVVVKGLGPYDRMSFGRRELRENPNTDEFPTIERVPEGRAPMEYAEEVGGILAYGTYVPKGFERTQKGHST